MSWWEVIAVLEKVSVFTPAFLDKLLKRSMEQADELRLEWRLVDMVSSQKQIQPTLLHSSFIVTLASLFGL